MMRMDLEEATCKAVSGFKPFFLLSSLDNSSTGLLNKKIKIDNDTLIKLFTFSQLTETKVPNSNILINNLVYWFVSDKNRATGSYEHGFVRTQELHWPRNDADSWSDGLSNAYQRLPVPRIWMECFQHGWTYQQWVTRKLTFIYNTS